MSAIKAVRCSCVVSRGSSGPLSARDQSASSSTATVESRTVWGDLFSARSDVAKSRRQDCQALEGV
jgi:hypothetical protein